MASWTIPAEPHRRSLWSRLRALLRAVSLKEF